MDNLTNINTVKELLNKYGFTFSKGLGQNFIVNPSVCPKMAELSTASGIGVIEIGPGFGVLTNELCKIAKKVVAIEVDKRLLPVLSETLCEYDNLKIVNADVLELDIQKLIDDEFPDMDVVVCANLPYYITSPVIMKLLEEKSRIKSLTVMVQKEAAQRICAEVGTRECGAVTVSVHYYSKPEYLFSVSKGSFMPSPKVDSAVIKLDILDTPNVVVKDEKTFFKVVRASFSQRRKTIVNALSAGLNLDKSVIFDILKMSNVDSMLRGEKLTLDDFAKISDLIYEKTL
ncbi:MAG: 16S rRNA (adenine(1518)-N(6)/adenine(1519)-N(6))-dimethyltransferase RsmA [Oscillospiraceae bacterium]|nr:16S rRNA (adenine(1518)-N(6)/adenine(1519)-N(6))-dimethyltransferase RsmA [Candidatus Ruminococcus equi]